MPIACDNIESPAKAPLPPSAQSSKARRPRAANLNPRPFNAFLLNTRFMLFTNPVFIPLSMPLNHPWPSLPAPLIAPPIAPAPPKTAPWPANEEPMLMIPSRITWFIPSGNISSSPSATLYSMYVLPAPIARPLATPIRAACQTEVFIDSATPLYAAAPTIASAEPAMVFAIDPA
ncbi:MAG: hypothetical protein JW847_05645 [Candidatus Omnitrophica bacterium]|nr:hypothetical protein [Candidatus Omnitrophota bacterium]